MPRTRKDCPLPYCNSKRLSKLSNHLIQVHGMINPVDRQRCLKCAKVSYSDTPSDSTLKELYKIIGLLNQPSNSHTTWIEY